MNISVKLKISSPIEKVVTINLSDMGIDPNEWEAMQDIEKENYLQIKVDSMEQPCWNVEYFVEQHPIA